MSAALDRLRSLLPPTALPGAGEEAAPASRWSRAALAGRFAELSAGKASAVLTLAFSLVWDAQREGEPVAWLSRRETSFYPPDAAQNGIDLKALAVVHLPDAETAARAASQLARSGAFGLIVLDLGRPLRLAAALQGRLAQQALRHDMAILCLTETPTGHSPPGSLVSLRGRALRQREGEGRFVCTLSISKDKRNGPGWNHAEVFHGPPGLR